MSRNEINHQALRALDTTRRMQEVLSRIEELLVSGKELGGEFEQLNRQLTAYQFELTMFLTKRAALMEFAPSGQKPDWTPSY